MPEKPAPSLRCPTCRSLVLSGEENFPFCSDRCRLIDLGKWASGGYVISTAINDPEELENMRSEEDQSAPTQGRQEKRSRDTRERNRLEDQTIDPDYHERS